MKSQAEGGSIQITSNVYEIIKNEFEGTARGMIQVKKDAMTTYLLIRAKA